MATAAAMPTCTTCKNAAYCRENNMFCGDNAPKYSRECEVPLSSGARCQVPIFGAALSRVLKHTDFDHGYQSKSSCQESQQDRRQGSGQEGNRQEARREKNGCRSPRYQASAEQVATDRSPG